jgi:hypothetical protein
MAVTITYGSYNFVSAGPTPQVGIDIRYERPNDGGPAYMVYSVRVVGYFANFNDYALNQGAVNTLRTALKTDNQTLTFSDGSHTIVSHEAKVVSVTMPTEWGQYSSNYEIVFEYKALDITQSIVLTTTLGAFTFAPTPNFGRQYETQSAVMRCKVTINGFFAEGTVALNQAKIDSLKAIVSTGSAALVYSGVSATLRNIQVDSPTAWTKDVLPYTVTGEFDTARSGLISGSVALGSYTFTLVPNFGRKYTNDGHLMRCEVTLSGSLDAGSIAANQSALESIAAVCDDTKATMVYGSFSQSVRNMRVDAPSNWTELFLPFTITAEYAVARAAITEVASLGSFTFPVVPSMGRRYQNNGHRLIVEIVLSGIFRGDGINANQTLLTSLAAVCDDASATLTYGSFVQTVRKMRVDAPSNWTEDELPFTVTCEYATTRAAVTETCSLGVVSLSPVPAMGRRYQRDGHFEKCEVTLVGVFTGAGVNANQVLATALEAVCNASSAALAYGSFNATLRNMRCDIPGDWSEDELPYTVTGEFVTSRAAAVTESCTLCGYTFPQLPSFGRRQAWKRKSAQTSPTMVTTEVTLSGKIATGGVNGNVGAINSLLTAVGAGSGTLSYGSGFSQTVRIVSVDMPTDWVEDYLPYTIVCEYDSLLCAGNIVDYAYTVQKSEVYQRTAFHEIPYANGRVTQSLGLSHMTITYSGYYVGVAFSDALAAYYALVQAHPATGILLPGGTRTEDYDGKRVDFNVTYSYDSAAIVEAAVSIR